MPMKGAGQDGHNCDFDSVASEYDELTSFVPPDIWVRAAFRSLVLETAVPGSLLLDFGCGTGTDALWYVEQGYRVIAYDNSAKMIERLRVKCATQIARNEIIPYYAEYDAFLKRDFSPRPEAIVSNFAVLSVISGLPELFKGLAGKLVPHGHVMASVLNPLFWQDTLHKWWWRAWARSLGQGNDSGGGEQAHNLSLFFEEPHFRCSSLLRHYGPGRCGRVHFQ